jgi:putative ABC transport system permease protein
LALFGVLIVLFLPSLRRLSFNIWLGAIATGLAFSLVALGVYLSFRVLDFPDLTIDGAMPLGAALSATLIVSGINPYVTLPVAFFGGALAGTATALIATRLRIHSLLASILVTTGLISINLRIMGKSNIPLLNVDTLFTPFAQGLRDLLVSAGGEQMARLSNNILAIILFGFIVLIIKLVLDWLMRTEIGLAIRATGDNSQMIRALGVNTDHMIILGLALSNGLVGLAGALIAQYQGFADVNMGIGLIIAGLAAVILGETFFRPDHFGTASTAVIFGMIIYRVAIAAALVISIPLPNGEKFTIDAQDVKLVTALLVLGALAFAQWQKNRSAAARTTT